MRARTSSFSKEHAALGRHERAVASAQQARLDERRGLRGLDPRRLLVEVARLRERDAARELLEQPAERRQRVADVRRELDGMQEAVGDWREDPAPGLAAMGPMENQDE